MILERFKVPRKDQVLVPEAELRRTVTQIFEKLRVSPDDAAEAADVLTMTDLRGVETHGVSNMLRRYVPDYKAAKLDPRQQDPAGHPGRIAALAGLGHRQGRQSDHGGEARLRPRRVSPGTARRHAGAGLP